MNDSLIERLRMFCCDWPYDDEEMTREAADRLEDLEAKMAKAVEALASSAQQHRIIAGMDLIGASAVAYNAARAAESTLVELNYE